MQSTFGYFRLFFSFAFPVLGLVIVIMSLRLGFGGMKEPAPGFFPFFIGVLITILGIGVVRGFLLNRRVDVQDSDMLSNEALKKISRMMVAFCAWAALINWLGYIVVTFFVSLSFAKTMGLEGWVRPIVLSSGIALL